MPTGFYWAGDLNGAKNPICKEFYISSSTVVYRGEPVNFTQGTGITKLTEALSEDFDDPILGISMVDHDGSTSGYDSGNKLLVSYSPTAIYKYKCNAIIPLTGGSTTTAVNSNLLPATNSFWKGGKIKIVSCAADSSLNGKEVSISDSTGASGTLTLAETLPVALAAADTILLCPGPMADGILGYDLWYNSANISGTALRDIDFTSDGGAILRLMHSDPDNFEVTVMFEKSAIAS